MKNCLSSLRHFLHAFSLVEMLMALLVASLLLAALAPVMTRRMADENITLSGNMNPAGTTQHIVEIEYNSDDCSEIKTDSDGSTYCEGEFVVPGGYNGYINATVIGAGGGGGTAPTAGYTEYTTAANHSFPVPAMVGNIETTLVEGGAGGGAGYVDPNIKGYAWTHSGVLNRSYVSTNYVTSNIKNIKVSGNTYSASYAHGTATFDTGDIKNLASDTMFITLAGGGGGGGRGYVGTGGGGGAARSRYAVTIIPGNKYSISVGAGGQGHSCGGYHGCGGSASNFGGLVMAGGGGGGAWTGLYGDAGTNGPTAGENGGSAAVVIGSCGYSDATTSLASGGYGASPGGSNGGNQICTSGSATQPAGSSGGASIFGKGGIYGTSTNNGQGYGGGGCGGGANPTGHGNGAPGFVAAEWLEFSNGGGGGGGASMLPLKKTNVTPGENLTVEVGEGGTGGIAGNITNSITSYTKPSDGKHSNPSRLKRGNAVLISTSGNNNAAGLCSCGGCAGDTAGSCSNVFCSAGWIGDCNNTKIQVIGGFLKNTDYPGFATGYGSSAGNKSAAPGSYTGVLTPADGGGNGGGTEIFGKKTCEPGKGSTVLGTGGENAAGYGGCGGGGGYGLAKGGNGAPGYARISWNKYWDTITNAYKLSETGAGGGGASGNILTYSFEVKSNQIIKFRIGKGGNGAYVSNNVLINAAKGGDTVFGNIKAGGGGGGASVSINTANEPVNGAGGSISNVCHFGTTNYINNKKCIKGTHGSAANNLTGGKGADFTGYTITLKAKNNEENTETKKEIKGTGGTGGTVDTGDNANGKSAQGIASGGGGASLRDMGQVNSSSTSNIANNQNRGGNGANGKIILEWWE